MSELELFEPETLINVATLLITLAVFLVTALAYYRTRLRGVLIVSLLAALLATNILVQVGDDFLEDGIETFKSMANQCPRRTVVLLHETSVRRCERQQK